MGYAIYMYVNMYLRGWRNFVLPSLDITRSYRILELVFISLFGLFDLVYKTLKYNVVTIVLYLKRFWCQFPDEPKTVAFFYLVLKYNTYLSVYVHVVMDWLSLWGIRLGSGLYTCTCSYKLQS